MRTAVVLRPRDPAGAAAAALNLAICAFAITLVATLLSPGHLGTSPLRWPALALLALSVPAAAALRRMDDAACGWWAVVPVAWPAALVVAAVGLRNRDLHVELLLLFPAMYGCRQLQRPAALALVGTCTALVPVLAAFGPAAHSELFVALFFAPALAAVTVRLIMTGARFDGLLSAMRKKASTDELTGLANRQAMEQAFGRPHPGAHSIALLLIDIDNFKEINDRYGHPAGDDVLRTLAGMVSAKCRSSDLPCRLGGDELAVLYYGLSLRDAHRRGDEIRADIEHSALRLSDGTGLQVTVSLGIAHSAVGRESLTDMYERADRALYRAKRAGRNVVVLDDVA